jgi:hypothetical protein
MSSLAIRYGVSFWAVFKRREISKAAFEVSGGGKGKIYGN